MLTFARAARALQMQGEVPPVARSPWGFLGLQRRKEGAQRS